MKFPGMVNLAILAASLFALHTHGSNRPKIGTTVPDFSVKTSAGKEISRATCKGNALVVIFVRPEQQYSLDALRIAGKIKAAHGDGLRVVAILTKPDKNSFFGKAKINFPIASDAGNRAYSAFGVIVSPTTYVIDAKGTLRYRLPHLFSGYAEKLSAHVDLTLGKITPDQHQKLLADRKLSLTEQQLEHQRQLALAKALVSSGKAEDALLILKRLKSSKDPSVTALHGVAYLALGRTKEAAAILGPYRKEKSLPNDLQLALARLAVRLGDAKEAEQRLANMTEPATDVANALAELGRLYEGNKQTDKALACYRRSLQLMFPEKKISK